MNPGSTMGGPLGIGELDDVRAGCSVAPNLIPLHATAHRIVDGHYRSGDRATGLLVLKVHSSEGWIMLLVERGTAHEQHFIRQEKPTPLNRDTRDRDVEKGHDWPFDGCPRG